MPLLINMKRSEVKVTQSGLTLCDPMDYIVHEILQARILEWVAFPFFRGSSQCRDRTQVSHVAGRFFTRGATKEAKEYWSGWPIPASAQLSYPGIKPVSPALQADSLPTELSGKPTKEQSRSQTISTTWHIGAPAEYPINDETGKWSSLCVYVGSYFRFWVEEGNGNPLQYLCLENPMDGGAW